MRRDIICLVFSLLVLLTLWLPRAEADDTRAREYQLKAAFVYNFFKFIDSERLRQSESAERKDDADPNAPLVIGIIGTPPSAGAFETLRGKKVGNRLVAVKRFKGFTELETKDEEVPERHPNLTAIKKCHVLFICPSERAFIEKILAPLRKECILTVGDVPGFLEEGGVINFVLEERNVRFEINTAAATRARIEIRSRLLRLARRIIEHDRFETKNDEGNRDADGK